MFPNSCLPRNFSYVNKISIISRGKKKQHQSLCEHNRKLTVQLIMNSSMIFSASSMYANFFLEPNAHTLKPYSTIGITTATKDLISDGISKT